MPVNALARSLDVLAILAIVVRLGFTFRDYARVLEVSRQEALLDAITGLGNRRKLMRDLERGARRSRDRSSRSSTSTASRATTTPSATPPATRC